MTIQPSWVNAFAETNTPSTSGWIRYLLAQRLCFLNHLTYKQNRGLKLLACADLSDPGTYNYGKSSHKSRMLLHVSQWVCTVRDRMNCCSQASISNPDRFLYQAMAPTLRLEDSLLNKVSILCGPIGTSPLHRHSKMSIQFESAHPWLSIHLKDSS